jgi:hypothetical protein
LILRKWPSQNHTNAFYDATGQNHFHRIAATRRAHLSACPEVVKRAHINAETYAKLYARSVREPDQFWLEQANELEWFRKPTVACKYTWDTAARRIEHTWFADGQLNLSVNCLDRHLKTATRNKTAIIWQGEGEDEVKRVTYAELHGEVCKFANVLKSLGIKKGDRVSIYMPMVVEAAVVMLACTRIGAIHSIVFGGFSADSLSGASMIPPANCWSLPTPACAAESRFCSRTSRTPR